MSKVAGKKRPLTTDEKAAEAAKRQIKSAQVLLAILLLLLDRGISIKHQFVHISAVLRTGSASAREKTHKAYRT
jgi:hypothetical protein